MVPVDSPCHVMDAEMIAFQHLCEKPLILLLSAEHSLRNRNKQMLTAGTGCEVWGKDSGITRLCLCQAR